MDVEMQRVALDEKPVLANLLQLYLHDHSEFDGYSIGEDGLYFYRYFDHYWIEEGRHAFLIRVDGEIAGFAMIRDATNTGDTHSIAEFLVLRKFRRRGVGTEVVKRVFDSFPGRWKVQQQPFNLSAQAFWRRVISDYTGGDYTESTVFYDGEDRPCQEFTSPGKQ